METTVQVIAPTTGTLMSQGSNEELRQTQENSTSKVSALEADKKVAELPQQYLSAAPRGCDNPGSESVDLLNSSHYGQCPLKMPQQRTEF